MKPPDGFRCSACQWSGDDLRWAAVADGFGRHAGECPACARRFRGCYLSAPRLRERASAQRADRARCGRAAGAPPDSGAPRREAPDGGHEPRRVDGLG